MALVFDISILLLDILTANECPEFAMGEIRVRSVLELADFVGLEAHDQDIGEFFYTCDPSVMCAALSPVLGE